MGLKELRLKRGMTQRELAQRSGVHPLRLRRSKRVNATSGRCRLILRLCDALRVANPRKLLDPDSETSAD